MTSSQLTSISTPSSTNQVRFPEPSSYFLSLSNTYPHVGGWSRRGPPISAASLTVCSFAGSGSGLNPWIFK
ncbi:putative prion, copper binding octapeptide [Helianthus anomalus]